MFWACLNLDLLDYVVYILERKQLTTAYRPPNRTDDEYTNSLINDITSVRSAHKNAYFLLGGDFNLPDLEWPHRRLVHNSFTVVPFLTISMILVVSSLIFVLMALLFAFFHINIFLCCYTNSLINDITSVRSAHKNADEVISTYPTSSGLTDVLSPEQSLQGLPKSFVKCKMIYH
jgi:hypothetical protein